jgi:ribosomal protein L10
MPSREQLLSELGASMQAPLGQFVGALNGLLNTFVGALDALKQQKEAA